MLKGYWKIIHEEGILQYTPLSHSTVGQYEGFLGDETLISFIGSLSFPA